MRAASETSNVLPHKTGWTCRNTCCYTDCGGYELGHSVEVWQGLTYLHYRRYVYKLHFPNCSTIQEKNSRRHYFRSNPRRTKYFMNSGDLRTQKTSWESSLLVIHLIESVVSVGSNTRVVAKWRIRKGAGAIVKYILITVTISFLNKSFVLVFH